MKPKRKPLPRNPLEAMSKDLYAAWCKGYKVRADWINDLDEEQREAWRALAVYVLVLLASKGKNRD